MVPTGKIELDSKEWELKHGIGVQFEMKGNCVFSSRKDSMTRAGGGLVHDDDHRFLRIHLCQDCQKSSNQMELNMDAIV